MARRGQTRLTQKLDARFDPPRPDDEPRFSYRIDPTAAPKTIDLVDRFEKEPLAAVGIYEIAADQLKICLARYQSSLTFRPAARSVSRLVPVREIFSSSSSATRPSEDEKAMQGRWVIATQIEDGKPVFVEKSAAKIDWFDDQFVGIGENTSWGNGVWALCLGCGEAAEKHYLFRIRVRREGIVQVGRERKPQEAELLGIYRLDGERLTIAYRKGGPRPEKFSQGPARA